jgi:hypothetical protein
MANYIKFVYDMKKILRLDHGKNKVTQIRTTVNFRASKEWESQL